MLENCYQSLYLCPVYLCMTAVTCVKLHRLCSQTTWWESIPASADSTGWLSETYVSHCQHLFISVEDPNC